LSALIIISAYFAMPVEVPELNPYSWISNDIKIVVVESETINRTLYLDTSQWYCKSTVFTGGDAPWNWDLAHPYDKIVFFFLEDIENKSLADNWGDLIIRMNPIKDKVTGQNQMVIVFYAEGGYGKLVYYRNDLILYNYTYVPEHPELTKSYGISVVDYP